jgi:hypothetical protein
MENKKTEFYKAFSKLQETIKVKKENRNDFGKYDYRTIEDIFAEVKKNLNGLILYLSDEVVMVGTRFYLKATATITDGDYSVSNSAYAREECFTETSNTKASPAQITGGASSYARKYALSGLLLLENEKDDDAQDQNTSKHSTTSKPTKAPTFSAKPASAKQKSFLSKLNVDFTESITAKEASKLIEKNMNKPPSKSPPENPEDDAIFNDLKNTVECSTAPEALFVEIMKGMIEDCPDSRKSELREIGKKKLEKIRSEQP